MIHLSIREIILWILANSSGKMEKRDLRRRVGMKLVELEPILGELAWDGMIRITGETVSLI
jgi:hypothetical protein